MNRACVLTRPHTLEWEDRPLPPLRPEEVRIRPAFAGICGTDLALFRGEYAVPLPLVPGHEFNGEVVEVADAAFEALLGRVVAAEINHHCLARADRSPCRACRRGLQLHCQRRSVFGIINQDGAFQRQTVALARNCHALPEALAGRFGVFVEPLAAALNTFDTTHITEGELVVVLGGGRLGSLIALVARRLGADVMAVCRGEGSRRRLDSIGVPATALSTEAELIEAVSDRTEGFGADRVVDATGDPNALALCLKLVRPRGVVSLKSTPGLPTPPLDLTGWVVDEVTVEGTRCGDFARAIEFYERERLDLAPLIAAALPFDQIEAAFEKARHGGKVVLEFE